MRTCARHRSMPTHPARLSALALATALHAQACQEGHVAIVRPLPPFTNSVLALSASTAVYWTGTRLVLDDGAAPRDLLLLPGYREGSFTTLVAPGLLMF